MCSKFSDINNKYKYNHCIPNVKMGVQFEIILGSAPKYVTDLTNGHNKPPLEQRACSKYSVGKVSTRIVGGKIVCANVSQTSEQNWTLLRELSNTKACDA